MKSFFIDQRVEFSPSLLKLGHFHRRFGLSQAGDSILAFNGPFRHERLFFRHMLHFVLTHKRRSFEVAELKKRLLLSGVCAFFGDGFRRIGPQAFYGDLQLSISSTVTNRAASLTHIGFFMYSDDAYSETTGLDQFDVNPKEFAYLVMRAYCDEMNDIKLEATL